VKRREERNKKRTQRNVKSIKQNFKFYYGITGHILGEGWYLQLQRLCRQIPKKEAASCSETSEHIHKSTRCNFPEDLNPNPHPSENPQSRKKTGVFLLSSVGGLIDKRKPKYAANPEFLKSLTKWVAALKNVTPFSLVEMHPECKGSGYLQRVNTAQTQIK
jgi:hypothetical protein